MSLAEIIRKYRREHGLSLRAFAAKTGLSHAYIDNLEKGLDPHTGKPTQPTIDTLIALARGMDMSLEQLIKAAGYFNIGLGERPLASPALERYGTEQLTGAGNVAQVQPARRIMRVPVLGVIRAGEPIYAAQNIEGWEEIPKEWVNGECFFLRVVGDSMAGARIQEGDLVFVRRQDYAENGDIVVAILNGEDATIKRIFFTQDAIILHPENPKYKPIVLQGKDRSQLTIIGKVLWFKGIVK